MPRGFSGRERAAIRANLLSAARERIAAVGMQKTSIEELARAAHISKGAFYGFFPSKESLFMTVLEESEQRFREQMRAHARLSSGAPRERVLAFFSETIRTVQTDPLLGRMTRRDMDDLLRGLPAGQVQQALQSDVTFFEELLALWRAHGLTLNCTAVELTGITQALGPVVLYETEFGDTYRAATRLILDALADHLTRPAG